MNSFLLAEGASGSSILWLVILIVMVVVMLVLPSITQKKKIAAYQEMQNRLKAGDKVQTIGGIVGKINRIKEKDGVKTVLIETGDKSNKMVIEFDINAIAGVVEGINPAPQVEEKKESEEVEAEVEEPTIVDVSFDEEENVEEKKEEKKTTSKKSNKKK